MQNPLKSTFYYETNCVHCCFYFSHFNLFLLNKLGPATFEIISHAKAPVSFFSDLANFVLYFEARQKNFWVVKEYISLLLLFGKFGFQLQPVLAVFPGKIYCPLELKMLLGQQVLLFFEKLDFQLYPILFVFLV